MVNFFDVATPKEIEEQYDKKLTPEEISSEKEFLSKSPNKNYAYLFGLYLHRGHPEIANKYLDLISDPDYRQSILDVAFGLEI